VSGGFAEPAHGDAVAAGFTKRGGENLDDPEAERDRGDFAERFAIDHQKHLILLAADGDSGAEYRMLTGFDDRVASAGGALLAEKR
jgi:hypothetical protein